MSLTQALNLLPGEEAKRRSENNHVKILNFLSQESFSTRQILQDLLRFKTKSGVCRILAKMEKKNLIKKFRYSSILTIWGITSAGLKETGTDTFPFMPSRFSLSTLEHSLDVQKVHVMCISKNIDFRVGRDLGSRSESDKIPDGIMTLPSHQIAIEVERTQKSAGRYDAIIYNYLKSIKNGTYQKVLYVMPDSKRCTQIKNCIYSLGEITMDINGRKEKLALDEQKHLSYFHFLTLKSLPEYLALFLTRTSG